MSDAVVIWVTGTLRMHMLRCLIASWVVLSLGNYLLQVKGAHYYWQ